MKIFENPKIIIPRITGVEFSSYLDRNLIPNFYDPYKDSLSLLFTRTISKSENSIFTLLELRRFRDSSKFNLTLSLKNIKGPEQLPSAVFVRIINSVVSIYGNDDGDLGKIENSELEDLDKNSWIGRAWLNKNDFQIPIMIGQDEGNYFYITFFLDNKYFE